jgi:hypothetical protein
MRKKIPSKLLTVEYYIKGAQLHGIKSEWEHEIGDLQGLFRASWNLLTPEQRLAFATDEHVQSLVRYELDDFDKQLARLSLSGKSVQRPLRDSSKNTQNKR